MAAQNGETVVATQGYTELLQAAAASGTDDLGDDVVGSMVARFENAYKAEDPQQELRDRCAAQLLAAAARSLEAGTATPKALLVDVGSGIGADAGRWRSAGDAAGLGADRLDITGVELLGKLNEKAAVAHPDCRFLTGDATELPLDAGTVDGIHCSRLLIHSPDTAKALDEMVRVLRPGGIGVLEEGDFATGSLMTGDARALAVFHAQQDARMVRIKNPHAARVAHTLLRAREDVENVVIEPYPLCMLDYETIDPGLEYLMKELAGLVAAGTITQEDSDHYVECVRAAPRVGEPYHSNMIFKISFNKKAGAVPA